MNIFINGVKIPVNPEELTIGNSHTIETVRIIETGEIPLAIGSQLKTIEWKSFVPGSNWDGAYQRNSQISPSSFIRTIESFKETGRPVRVTIGGGLSSVINSLFLIEEFELSTKYGYHEDAIYSIKFKQFKEHKPRKIEIKKEEQEAIVEEPIKEEIANPVKPEPRKEESSEPVQRTHTVVSGDTLWAIAQKNYGNGSQYPKIFNANRDKISDPNLIYPGQVLVLP